MKRCLMVMKVSSAWTDFAVQIQIFLLSLHFIQAILKTKKEIRPLLASNFSINSADSASLVLKYWIHNPESSGCNITSPCYLEYKTETDQVIHIKLLTFMWERGWGNLPC